MDLSAQVMSPDAGKHYGPMKLTKTNYFMWFRVTLTSLAGLGIPRDYLMAESGNTRQGESKSRVVDAKLDNLGLGY